MRKFFSQLKSSPSDDRHPKAEDTFQKQYQSDGSLTLTPPSRQDILRYRLQHGVNLGGVFVLERWLFGSLFHPHAKGGSELDAVTASIAAVGVDATRTKWEAHWQDALSDADIEFLVKDAGCTSVRVPIGYFTLGGEYCRNTPFEARGIAEVYVNAWAAVRELSVRLERVGIGTLLDFHALPGGANKDEHSGSSSGKAELWHSGRNLKLAKSCLLKMAEEVKVERVRGCIGIQLCNEAEWGAKGLYDFYEDVVQDIAKIDSTIPIYISDAWDLTTAIEWTKRQNRISICANPIIIDTHRYYTFTVSDRSKSPQQIIAQIPNEIEEVAAKSGNVCDHGAVQVVVGEWSCVLDGATWDKAGSNVSRDDLVRQFGISQCRQWRERASGSFFWTAKMDWMDGGEWGFFDMTKKGAINPLQEQALGPSEIRIRLDTARQQLLVSKKKSVDSHVQYWNQICPGQHFEHWRFERGFDQGFEDGTAFFGAMLNEDLGPKAGGKIGALEIWTLKRLRESGNVGEFGWEFEQGFRQGMKAIYTLIDI
ncbi:Glucan 1,3-beta-glucosidase 3 [Bachmanniomyces sp. S44760]|nr:Glucan 1,3-beta-glucosidase 3 [Bachmanniomyces sp. S44760]